MHSETVEIPTADGLADAYLTRPDDQPHPGVLYIMDAYGLRPTIDEMADRIAADGYVVLAPNVFYRAGRPPVVPLPDLSDPEQRAGFFQSIRPLIGQLTPERLAAQRAEPAKEGRAPDRKSTRLKSSHRTISYAGSRLKI